MADASTGVNKLSDSYETPGETVLTGAGALVVPENNHNLIGTETRDRLVEKVLLAQLSIGLLAAVVFWVSSGVVAGYSALLGGLICVIPNSFLALRLTVPRADPGARPLLRAAYFGELGKLALTVMLFTLVFTTVKPLAGAALFVGFILGKLAVFAGFLTRRKTQVVTSSTNGE